MTDPVPEFQRDVTVANALGLRCEAAWGVDVTSVQQVIAAQNFARSQELPLLCLGDASNVVLHDHLDAVVCRLANNSVEVLEETSVEVTLRVGAGWSWHEFVESCLAQGRYGLENLILIPGTVGAAPVQNIGAYGVELADRLLGLIAVDSHGKAHALSTEECCMAYRDSRFKHETGWIIVSLDLRLSKIGDVDLSYPELAKALEQERRAALVGTSTSPREVADAVMALRRSKLPDPQTHPNVGSFFKNPVVGAKNAETLRNQGLNTFAVSSSGKNESYKVPAAQLIDRCGWKGVRHGDVGCWPTQPLVLVNYANASALQVLDFAENVQRSVAERFSIQLELEPSVIPPTANAPIA